MKPILNKLLFPLIWLRRKHDDYLRKKNPEKLFSIWHKRAIGVRLNLDNPKTLYEKIAYMAFRTDTSEWSRLADKVRVREYVAECGYEDYVPKLYGVWESAEDIDFEKLPNAFVVKTNNASATNILVKDKSAIDEEIIRSQLGNWLKVDYGYLTCQPHYSRIKPLILAEEYLDLGASKSLIDYKFYCVNGIPEFVQVMTDRKPNTHDLKLCLMDMNWKSHPEYCRDLHEQAKDIVKPASFEIMRSMASRLSSKFPFARVDFYEINNKPVFGEITFTPGFDTINADFESFLGSKIRL